MSDVTNEDRDRRHSSKTSVGSWATLGSVILGALISLIGGVTYLNHIDAKVDLVSQRVDFIAKSVDETKSWIEDISKKIDQLPQRPLPNGQ